MLSRLVIAFLPRSKRLLILWLQSPSAVILDYSLSNSSVHGILQAGILKWVAMPSSRVCSLPRDLLCLLHWQGGLLSLAPSGKPKSTFFISSFQNYSSIFCPLKFLKIQFSVQFSRSVVSDSLQLHEPQHARPPCPSPTPGAYLNSCPLSRWCHPIISPSVIPFSSCPQSFPASGSFQMSQIFTSGGQSIWEFQLQHQSFQWTFRSDFL